MVGVLAVALVISMFPAADLAAADPTEPPQTDKPVDTTSDWVSPTGSDPVRPDWLSAALTARSSGQRVEVLSARTESARSWVLPSGAVTSELTGEVRFKDPAATAHDGWREIDTTLEVSSDGAVAPSAVPGSLKLSGGGDDSGLISYTSPSGRSVKLGSGLPDVALPKPTVDGATATYSDVLPGVDIRVEARTSGFEQLWVIKNAAGLKNLVDKRGDGSEVSLVAPLTVGKASVSPAKDGSVEFTDSSKKKVAALASPTMWDGDTDAKTGAPTRVQPVNFTVTAGNTKLTPADPAKTGKLALSVKADQDWLTDPGREFPIVIDPTYEDGSSQVTFDTYVRSGDTLDRSTDGELWLGYDGSAASRSFLNVATSGLAGRKIMSGSLTMWETWSASCTPSPWSAYTAGAASTATRWTAQPTIGSKYATSTATKGFSASCAAGEVSIDIKSQLQAWADAGAATQGLMLRADSETDPLMFKRFESSQGARAPKLTWTSNRAPEKTDVPMLVGASPYKAAGDATPVSYTSATQPTVSAVVTDSDADTLTATFQASTTTTFTTIASSCTSSAVASAASASCALSTALAADGRYYLRVRAQDSNGVWGAYSDPVEFRVASVLPTAPVITCPAPYSNGAWQTAAPAADVTCTITATGTGYSAPAWIRWSVDGNPVFVYTPITQSSSTSVAKTTVTLPKTVGGHSIRAHAVGPTGINTATSFYTGWGDQPLLKRPRPSNPRITTADKIEINAAGKGQASPAPTAKTQWRVSGATTATAGWVDAPAGNALTVTQNTGQSIASGFFDTTTIVGLSDASSIPVNGRVPTLIDVRTCQTTSGITKCSAEFATILRVPHAFSSGYPTTDAGPGQVALWTGELSVDDSDADLATPTGGLSVSRSHLSFNGTPSVQNAVFGPGWVASFDGDDSGAGGAELYDGTNGDGTLAVVSSDGDVLVFSTPSGTRRTTSTIPTGSYKPADEDTQTSGTSLVVSGSGASTVAELKGDDGIITKFQVTAAPTTAAATFRAVEVREPATADKSTYSYDASGRVTAITAALPDGVGSCAPGTKTLGCRVLKISYATITTATSTTPGDFANQVKAISAQVNLDNDRELAAYKYDSSGRMVEAKDSRTGLTTTYGWTGSGTGLRLATLTPAGEAAYTFNYDTSANKIKNVSRPIPASAGGGTAQLDAFVYGVPTSGTGLPNVAASANTWLQAQPPTWGAAVFGPDQVISGITPAAVTNSEWWKRADFQYTDANGYTVNTVGWGAGDWQYTANDYDANGNIIRAFDERGTRSVLNGDTGGGTDQYATLTTYNSDITDSSGNIATPAGALVTDTYGPMKQAISADGSLQMLRAHTKTIYDQGAPNSGINSNTGQPYRLPTTVTTTSEYADGTLDRTLDRTFTGYDALVSSDKTGWELGQATSSTIDMDNSGTTNAGDITTKTRYDSKGRLIENRQPLSTGSDAGTRVTSYYTGATTGPTGCTSKPEWAGLACQVGPAAQPPGQTMPVTKTTGYTWDLQTATTVDTSGAVTSTTTTSYDTKDRPTTVATTVTGLASSAPVPNLTTSHDAATGNITGTTSTAGSTAMTYDNWGRQLTYTNTPAGQPADTGTTTYDALGRVTSVVDGNGQTSYTYDGTDASGNPETRGLATAVKVKTTGGIEYTSTGAYDHAGDLIVEKFPGNIIRRTTIDNAGQETGVAYNGQVVDQGSGTLVQDQPWISWTSFYTPLDQLNRQFAPYSGGAATKGRLGNTASALNRSFGYDKAGRLTFAKERYTNGDLVAGNVGCVSRTYAFDANGNRTSNNTIDPASDGSCTTTGGNPISRTYDTADRPTTGGNGDGNYAYDQLGRQVTLPAADAPHPDRGNVSLGYYDTDAIKTITQNGQTTSFTLDGAGRRHTQVSDGDDLVRHYTDAGDNPTWSVQTVSGTATTTRYAELINGDLGLTLTATGGVTTAHLDLSTPRDDIAATIDLPTGATAPGGTSSSSIGAWSDYNEYGIPRQTADTNPGSVTGIGYGWLGGKQRASLESGFTLMGARLYNRATGLFTSTDPIFGGNLTNFAYPIDPINKSDLTGKAFWIPLIVACIRFCYKAYKFARAGHRVYRAYRASRKTYVIGRNMARVQSYAARHGYRTYRPINARLYRGMSRISPRWANRVSYRHNRRWINRVVRRGNRVVDIGRGRNRGNGPYYQMERRITRGYWNYRRAY